jgi:glycosyltransferase involved in cell wall biosynthesis
MKASLCFVSLNNYPVLSGTANLDFVGGAEIQQMHLARGLAERGYPVSFITFDHGQTDGEALSGIHLYTAYEPDAGIRGPRFIHPRMTGLWRAMSRVDAAVYYQRGADSDTGVIAAWCRRHRRKFIFSVASDANCDGNLPTLPSRREKYMYRYGIRRADVVIAQTRVQQRMLSDAFGRDSVLIRGCAQSVAGDAPKIAPATDQSPRLLWIGRYDRMKRPELLFELAGACPEVTFDAVGFSNMERGDGAESGGLRCRLENVRVHGCVPHSRIGEYYERATALLCTSLREGFPNTFLEGWARGLATISTVDPDGIIATHRLGVVVDKPTELPAATRRFLSDRDEVAACGARARSYFLRNHRLDTAVEAYSDVIEQLTTSNAAAALSARG